jgi:anti-sigma factor RsiW
VAGRDIDPETLAALLDGRLDEPRRAAVLARLAAGDGFIACAEAAAALRDAEVRDEEPGG